GERERAWRVARWRGPPTRHVRPAEARRPHELLIVHHAQRGAGEPAVRALVLEPGAQHVEGRFHVGSRSEDGRGHDRPSVVGLPPLAQPPYTADHDNDSGPDVLSAAKARRPAPRRAAQASAAKSTRHARARRPAAPPPASDALEVFVPPPAAAPEPIVVSDPERIFAGRMPASEPPRPLPTSPP